jgi:subfamily B ATP-binding cassette protein MsbA
MKGKTTIVIAHHLATILKADTIFVVKDHRLVERGTHAELLAADGFYAELHEIQFATAPAVAGA